MSDPAVPAVPVVQDAPKVLGKASDVLAEIEAGKGAEATKDASVKSADAAPRVDPAPKVEPDETGRLARLARERRKFETDQKDWSAKNAAKLESADKWEKLQEAKSSKGRLAALEMLFDAGEIDTDLYTELTERVYNAGAKDTSLTREQADKLVETKLAAAEKARSEEAARKALEETTKRDSDHAEVVGNYLKFVNDAFQTNVAKYPTLAALVEIDRGMSGKDIQGYTEGYFKDKGAAPSPDDVLAHFEEVYSKKLKPQAKAEEQPVSQASTVTNGWRSDARPVEKKFASLKDSLEEAKREAGLIS